MVGTAMSTLPHAAPAALQRVFLIVTCTPTPLILADSRRGTIPPAAPLEPGHGLTVGADDMIATALLAPQVTVICAHRCGAGLPSRRYAARLWPSTIGRTYQLVSPLL